MIKRLLIALLVLGAVAGGIVGFNRFRDGMIAEFFANQAPAPLPVDTVVAEAGDWTPVLEAIGTVDAVAGIELALEAGGIVQEVGFEANERVEQGQPLVRLDSAVERADLAAAAASAELAERTLERVSSLGDRGVAATASVEEAQAALASARAQAQRIEALIEQKSLLAPFAGEIGIPAVEVGEFVTAGTAVASLQDTRTLRVDFTLPEGDLPRIAIGQPVRVAAGTGTVAEGAVSAIEPRVDAATRLVSVRAELANDDGALRPGQFVRVGVALPAEEGVVALPQTAVVTSLYGDYVYAVAPADGAADGAEGADAPLVARQVFVRTGSRRDGLVAIAEGVEAGDRVVVAGQNRLSNGAPVRLEEAGEGGGDGEGGGAASGAAPEEASQDAPENAPEDAPDGSPGAVSEEAPGAGAARAAEAAR